MNLMTLERLMQYKKRTKRSNYFELHAHDKVLYKDRTIHNSLSQPFSSLTIFVSFPSMKKTMLSYVRKETRSIMSMSAIISSALLVATNKVKSMNFS